MELMPAVIPLTLLIAAILALSLLPIPPSRTVAGSVEAATSFLLARQNADGSFTTHYYPSATSRMGLPFPDRYAGLTHTFFTTAFVGHALTFVGQTPQVQMSRQAAARYVLYERNTSGLWNYYGPKISDQEMDIPEDSDDTAVALAMLAENGLLPSDGLSALDTLRRQDGNYLVWARPVQGKNGVECVVSSNVLYARSALNQTDDEGLCKYLNDMTDRFRAGDTSCLRYYNYAAFAHAYSRALHDGGASCLQHGVPALLSFLRSRQTEQGWWGSAYNTCKAVTAQLNMGVPATDLKEAVTRLRAAQHPDGSWPAASWFVGPFRTFGSAETTTGFCLEALAKYQRAGGT